MPEAVPITVARLLSLVSWIGEHPGTTVQELGRHFGRTSRQITRDIENLGRVGDSLPGRSFEIDWDLYERERKLSIRTTLGADLPPRLTNAEATAILVGLHAIYTGLDESLRARLPRIAMAIKSLNPQTQPDVVLVAGRQPRDSFVQELADALGRGLQVRFCYTGKDQQTSTRIVDPWRIQLDAHGWLLTGWCHTAADQRTFRVSAMSDLHILDTAATHKPSEYAESEPLKIHLVIAPAAQWIIDELGAELLKRHVDGSIEVDLPIWDENWFISFLIDASPALLSAPTHYTEQMRNRAAQALDLWERAGVITEEK